MLGMPVLIKSLNLARQIFIIVTILFLRFIYFYKFGCFSCMYVSALRSCMVAEEDT